MYKHNFNIHWETPKFMQLTFLWYFIALVWDSQYSQGMPVYTRHCIWYYKGYKEESNTVLTSKKDSLVTMNKVIPPPWFLGYFTLLYSSVCISVLWQRTEMGYKYNVCVGRDGRMGYGVISSCKHAQLVLTGWTNIFYEWNGREILGSTIL